MESVWLIITTFRPTVLAVVAFLLLFVVGSLVLWIILELHRRRPIRRERRIHKRGLKELQGRQKRKAERDLFFDNVQRIMNDFNR